jgi:hypothetical protein
MLKPGKNGAIRTRVTADSARVRDICHRYAAGLYRQAFLTIGDSASAEPVTAADLAGAAQRWPRFSAAAVQAGFRTVEALPMRLRDQVIGALNLFGAGPDPFSPADL